MIPTCEPDISPEDIRAVVLALSAGNVALGPEVEAFEAAVAKVVGQRHAIATSSGSAALHIAVKLMGPRVYRVPALTFIATAEAVVHNGAELVIVDHGEPADISVNFYGQPPVYPAVIEDACEGLGSTPIGSATITCLSFNGNKIITTGGGGMALTNDPILAGEMRTMVSHYRAPGIEYRHAAIGFNYRMPAMNAALGLSQIARLDAHVASKRETAAHYESLGVHLLPCAPGATSTRWMPVALLDRPAAPVISGMQAQGVMARAVWYPLHKQPVFSTDQSLPVADDLHRRGIILPCSVGITSAQRVEVVAALRRALDTAGAGSPPPAS